MDCWTRRCTSGIQSSHCVCKLTVIVLASVWWTFRSWRKIPGKHGQVAWMTAIVVWALMNGILIWNVKLLLEIVTSYIDGIHHCTCRTHSRFAPSQWETSLQTIWHCIQCLDYFDVIWCRRACSSLVQAMAWHRVGDKSLPEQMYAKFRNATWCYSFCEILGIIRLMLGIHTIKGCSAPRRMARIQSAHCVCSSKQSLRLLLCDERPVVAENSRQTWASGLDEGNCAVEHW